MQVALSRSKLDFDCNSTKSSSGRPLALAVTGDREKFLKEEMNLIQKKHLLRKGSFKDLIPHEVPSKKKKASPGSNTIYKTARNSKARKHPAN